MGWIRNTAYDWTFFLAPVLLVLTLSPLDHASMPIIGAIGLFSLLLSGVHIASNWTLLYRDSIFTKFARFRYLHMGWMICLASLILSAMNLSLFISVYVYWGLWHFARQHWGISMIYKSRENAVPTESGHKITRHPYDYKGDKILIHLLYFLPLLIQFQRPGDFAFYTLQLYRFHLPALLAQFATVLYVICWVLFIGFGIYRLVKKQLAVKSYLMMFTSALSLGWIYFGIESFLLMYALISIPHSLQYIGLSLSYHEGKNTRIKKWNRQKNRLFFIAFWGFTVLYSSVAIYLIKLNEQIHSPLVYGLLGLTIFHFWVELFSWRPKYNPELKNVLFH